VRRSEFFAGLGAISAFIVVTGYPRVLAIT
jgi:hypothetical protein